MQATDLDKVTSMLKIRFDKAVEHASPETLRRALGLLLAPHASPVFGAARVIEHDEEKGSGPFISFINREMWRWLLSVKHEYD